MAPKLFTRKRDGRVEVRLNEVGRATVKEIFVHVVAAERDLEHDWHLSLNAPITPSRDEDDPNSTNARRHEIATNAELSLMSVDEEYLNDAEAWAWFATFQIALRSTAVANGVLTEERLAACPAGVLEEIRTLQQFLFDLAACF